MTAIDKSTKLIFNEFQKSLSESPLDVFYQTITSDEYSANGFQFNVKQPGTRALLDTDIWIRYNVYIRETGDYAIREIFNGPAAGDKIPVSDNRIAFRGGNVVARCLQNLNVQINNQTLNVQPYRFIDVLNRLYVSNEQAVHEFGASGGEFDSGNHGNRTEHIIWEEKVANGNAVANLFGIVNGVAVALNTKNNVFWHDSWHTQGPEDYLAHGAAVDLFCNMRAKFPVKYEFYNPGFSERVNKFVKKLREPAANTAVAAANVANAGNMYNGQVAAGNQHYWGFEIWERLAIPCFKMYSNDSVYGVIPNVVQMQIQGNFLTNMNKNFLRTTDNTLAVSLYWDEIPTSDCQLYLRWYTPPMTMVIPRELSIPYPKIVTWSQAITLTAMNADLTQRFRTGDTSNYNITLEAIPDLLLIYIKYSPSAYTYDTPDDYLCELTSLQLNIDASSGKMNQLNSHDLYIKWKKLLKHTDTKILDYDEWRQYCCVAALQPEDYGVRYGPGFSNQTVLGVTINFRNWHNNPAIMDAIAEPLGGALGAGTSGELIVTSIYNRNRLTIRADGSASQEMVKIAADFNAGMPASGNAEPEMRGRLNF